jgi:hypothetical protein
MKCRVCGNELIKFDDIIYRCFAESHQTTNLINGEVIDLEFIKIFTTSDYWYIIIFFHILNYTQIARCRKYEVIHPNGVKYEHDEELPFYHESGLLNIDLTNLDKVLETFEMLETFS